MVRSEAPTARLGLVTLYLLTIPLPIRVVEETTVYSTLSCALHRLHARRARAARHLVGVSASPTA